MYIVLEIQKNSEGRVATLVYAFEDRSQAEQKYHTVLAAAAVSGLPGHAAVMMLDNGYVIKRENYGTADQN